MQINKSNDRFEPVRVHHLVGGLIHEALPYMLLLHLPVALHDTRAALQAVVEVRDVHELRVVVHEHFLFVNLQKAGTQSLHDGAGAGVVAEGKQAVGLVEGWLVAVPHLEALLVPAHHREALL